MIRKNVAVHPDDEESADQAGADQAAQAEDPQRHDRVLDPRLDATNAVIRTAASGAEAEHLRASPSRGVVASTIA